MERATLIGKCYTVFLDNNALNETKVTLWVTVTNQRAKHIVIHIHDRAAKLGLNDDFWTGNMTVASLSIKATTRLDLNLKKSIFRRLSGSDLGADEYHDAITTWAEQQIRTHSGACWHPMFLSILSNATVSEIPYCSTLDSFLENRNHIYGILIKQQANEKHTGIRQPKEIPHYHVNQREAIYYNVMKRKESAIQVSFETDVVSVEAEVLLLDAIGLVANLGGWLGLLIGVSCYGGIIEWVDFVTRHLDRASAIKWFKASPNA